MLHRHFTTTNSNLVPEWEKRDVVISRADGTIAFEQHGVQVPKTWSNNATTILAQKYFRGTLGSEERESSLAQVIQRVVVAIGARGVADGYLGDDDEVSIFLDELTHILTNQIASFNSPVWFNIGVKGVPQQASACFILSVDDEMESILNWYREEGIIFKGGSGAGVNLSAIRSSVELIKGGGTASGPVSFMRGADASAGTIKSGGKTRRAAKMVILNVDHPDIEDFILSKANEERKARALAQAGFDMGIDGKDIVSIQYQNANNSVRVTDEFMEAVVADRDWDLRAVTTGQTVRTVSARDLMRQIAQATWECADPGMQFDSTINRWHTTPNAGRINGSNPCSEYMSLDNSSCNLASLNLLKFLNDDGTFDVESFVHTASLVFTAQDILINLAEYPTEAITQTTRAYRQLGLGYSNLGALLMTLGLPYDSHQARQLAAALTALMTGVAYQTSAELACRLGPFPGYVQDADSVLHVLEMHQDALGKIDESALPAGLFEATQEVWDKTLRLAREFGVRNAQATLLAPTGTISFLMDCDTTGIEPAFSLVTYKKTIDGATMILPLRSVELALERLGYTPTQRQSIANCIASGGDLAASGLLSEKHVGIFATAVGSNAISAIGHLEMMAAVQPFLSGAISKTVNVPEDTTVEAIEDLYTQAWTLGLKAVAIYRDNCKVSQPLSASKSTDVVDDVAADTWREKAVEAENTIAALQERLQTLTTTLGHPVRQRLPRQRRSRTYAFEVGGAEGYATLGEYEDGRPGEIFVKISKQGSTIAGIMDAFAIAVSLGLQHGVPLASFVRKFTNMRFEPAGITDDADIRLVSSVVDYLFRRIALDYMDPEMRAEFGIQSTGERMASAAIDVEATEIVMRTPNAVADASHNTQQNSQRHVDSPMCYTCGTSMLRTGSCYACPACGQTSGCS
jgi:ribonucleoside-diphosphate reductase alpha chain